MLKKRSCSSIKSVIAIDLQGNAIFLTLFAKESLVKLGHIGSRRIIGICCISCACDLPATPHSH
ncbi:Hypothetical protein PMT_2425 [Prochlorococcus marinus str. MIT 9313]|uniref:Uncharacterized protein n=1 Tax=Prochlorococcus marinus (strain MIT 9313) TaxID=74547 RepID=B9ERA2_PROMM|nr:Hypothetical protein PMT_2425 [Prochlorococcus marinus str. MIT 9313]